MSRMPVPYNNAAMRPCVPCKALQERCDLIAG